MVNDPLKSMEDRSKASINGFRTDLGTIRTGHASPALVEHIKVEYADTTMPLIQLAGISAPEAGLIVIQPWDKTSVRAIEKAISKSELGLNCSNDGHVIRIPIPPLSEERRKELIKIVHRRAEERRLVLRSYRHDSMDELKRLEKEKEISQDEHKRALDRLQKITDVHMAEIDKLSRDKEKELMEV